MRVALTPKQREALDTIDAAGWIEYYSQDIVLLCIDLDCDESEARRQQRLAAQAKLSDDSLELPDEAMCAVDIVDYLEMLAEDSLSYPDRGLRRAAGALANKITLATAQQEQAR